MSVKERWEYSSTAILAAVMGTNGQDSYCYKGERRRTARVKLVVPWYIQPNEARGLRV